MSSHELPATMKAWQYSTGKGGLEKNLTLNTTAPLPKQKSDQYLVKTIAAALNPVDYKIAEIPLAARLAATIPAVPGIDFVGRIVKAADGLSLKEGDLIFGAAGVTPVAGGALAEYAVASKNSVAAVPDGVEPISTAGIAIAGITAYQSIVPFVKEGANLLINGGSGGTGVFGIQFAKAVGCYVTTTCSTANVELCKSLGADEVIDYKQQDIVAALSSSKRKYDHVVDNVSHDPKLYLRCHEYTPRDAIFVEVGGEASFKHGLNFVKSRALPGFLGGGRRQIKAFVPVHKSEDFHQTGQWIQSGKVRPIVDSQFAFEDVPKAFEKLKTGRAKGKIVVAINADS